jgi:KUP system potassium uptake protein
VSRDEPHATAGLPSLAFGTLGIVYGDIGTSPIYAFREAFSHSELEVERATTYGVASVVFWALIIIVSVKYLAFVMRADNRGEGGILALTALVMPRGGSAKGITAGVITLGVFGTSLLYGDGLITPSISVLSAVEGFEVATSAFKDWVLPVSITILVILFSVQRRGTARIARVFSPVMVLWFVVLSVLGLRQIARHPGVLQAISPSYGFEMFADHPWRAFLSLGSIFLVVTGGEALYADMGHFGRRPIQLSWYVIVMPALLINYFGQAALLTEEPDAVGSPFYNLAPEWGITPLAVLATMASVIAAQALISGAYSLTTQAVQLDYLPRLKILHTSAQHIGQVYVPLVNWLLMLGCIGLVLGFRTSSNLASAYGIAVTTTMLITSLLFYRVVRDRWGWSTFRASLLLVPLMLVDAVFLAANVPKIPTGGWFPLAVGVALVVQMTTWRKGRQLVAARIRRGERPMKDVGREALESHVARVPGTAVYLFKDAGAAPPALVANLEHNKVLHETTLLLSVSVAEVPRVEPEHRVTYAHIGPGIHQIELLFGFMDEPDVPDALATMNAVPGFHFDLATTTFFLGREAVGAGKVPGMHPYREELFVLLNRGAASASRFFNLPPERVFEVGTQVEI